jgi:hypothetical protein
MSPDEVMASIFHHASNMEEELHGSYMATLDAPAPLISKFVVVGRGHEGGMASTAVAIAVGVALSV